MLRTELEVGKTYTHDTQGKYSRPELVRLESLEPQKPNQGWSRYEKKPNPNLVLVSVATRSNPEVRERQVVLLRNLHPEEVYHNKQEQDRAREEWRIRSEANEKELRELIYNRREEIGALFGRDGSYLETDWKGNLKLTLSLAEVKALLEKAAK